MVTSPKLKYTTGHVYTSAQLHQLIVDHLPFAYRRAKQIFERAGYHETDAFGTVHEVMMAAYARFSDPDPSHFKFYVIKSIKNKFLTRVTIDKGHSRVRAARDTSQFPTAKWDNFGSIANRVVNLGTVGEGSSSFNNITDHKSKDVAHEVISQEEIAFYRRVVDKDIYFVPFCMSVIDGLTTEEIARQLGVPNGTIMSRVHRARERLQKYFLGFFESGEPFSLPVALERSRESRLCKNRPLDDQLRRNSQKNVTTTLDALTDDSSKPIPLEVSMVIDLSSQSTDHRKVDNVVTKLDDSILVKVASAITYDSFPEWASQLNTPEFVLLESVYKCRKPRSRVKESVRDSLVNKIDDFLMSQQKQ